MVADYDTMLKNLRNKLPEETISDVRFEIPRANSMIQGNKTIIQNFSELADVLGRDSQHLLKYLSRELATSGNIQAHRALFQGKFVPMIIKSKIESYAREFVICEQCGKPDTKITKEGRISLLKCMACGSRKPLRII